MPVESKDVSGMRRFDHAPDRVAVTIGVRAYANLRDSLDASQLVSMIVAKREQFGARSYRP